MRSLVRILLIATLFVSPAVFAQEDTPEVARSLMEEAERARDAGRNDEAIAKYTRVIEVAPSLASAYINLGAIYFKLGKAEDAYRIFSRGVENAPADRTLLSNAAASAQQIGKSAEALSFVDRAIASNKRDASLYALRSTILRSLQRNDDALAAQQQAVALAPDDARLQFSLGNLLFQGGSTDAAIAAYRRAVELDRSYLRAWYNLGAALFEAGRYDDALTAYKKALEPIEQSFARKEKVDPIHARAYANLGAIYLRQKQYAQAADAYQKALRLEPADTGVLYNLAFIDFTTGKLDRAEEEYRRVLAADASLPLAYLHLGDIAWRRGNAAQAIQYLTQGMPRFDRDNRLAALHILGRAQIAQRDRAGARATFEEIAREQPDAVDALIHLTYEKMLAARDAGDLAAERAALETLMARGATDAMRGEHALILIRQGEFAAAQSELGLAPNVRALLPPFALAILDASTGKRDAAARALAQIDSPAAKANAGLLLWQLGRDTDARPLLAAARASFPEWSELTLALGDIAYKARRYDEAIELLSDAKCPNEDLCARQRRTLQTALLSLAADELSSSPRRAMQYAERAGADPIALFIRGTANASLGNFDDARELLNRAINAGLPAVLESAARKNIDAAQPQVEVTPAPEPTSSTPRRTVVVFLPDAPAENDRRLAEAINTMLAGSSVPLQIEFFRRAEDARAFVNANRDRVGVVISNPEFVSGDFKPRFQFSRDGRRTYNRVVVVPARSAIRNIGDLRGKTMSVVDILGEMGPAETVRVPDDLTAIANVLYGKTAAALVSEANPLLAQRGADLRVIATSAPQPLPVIAFAPMPEGDRTAIDSLLRGARSTFGTVAQIEREVPQQPKREITYVSVAALGLKPLDPPANLPLRVTADLPRIEIPQPPLP
jgi:tetratricopeptide (TPR) repeat protein